MYIQIFLSGSCDVIHSSDQTIVDQIANECIMSRWRMMNRVLTAIYDEELRPFGLKSSQLSLLVAVTKAGPVRRIDLGKHLSLNPSTLTRNLQVMLKQRWIEDVPDGTDHRGAPLRATPKGRKLVSSIAPAWQRAQARAKKMLGGDLVLSIRDQRTTTAG
jgi:DNA-binding MarR family transcriptional regulator